jgi:hypothetical protein
VKVPKIPIGRIYIAVTNGLEEVISRAWELHAEAEITGPAQLACHLLDQMERHGGGPTAFQRDGALVILALACSLDEGPPQSWDDLLARLDVRRLYEADEAAMEGITDQEVERVAVHCRALRCRLGEAIGKSDAAMRPRRLSPSSTA